MSKERRIQMMNKHKLEMRYETLRKMARELEAQAGRLLDQAQQLRAEARIVENCVSHIDEQAVQTYNRQVAEIGNGLSPSTERIRRLAYSSGAVPYSARDKRYNAGEPNE
jgi:hypothetical protein